MKSCASSSFGARLRRDAAAASIVAAIPVLVIACHEASKPDTPPVTTATATASAPAAAGGSAAASASAPASPSASAAPAPIPPPSESPVKAAFVQPPYEIADDYCARVLVAVVKGKMTVGKDTLDAGDVLVLGGPLGQGVKGNGLAVVASARETEPCIATARPAETRAVVRGKDTKELTWANGQMSAWLDVDDAKTSPELYLGRLAGTAPVAEHDHPTSWEILAAVEASGTFVLEGKEQRLGPKQIVIVPKGAKHQWRPDPGSKLVAIQMYAPPGPEQRFKALAAGK